MTPGGSDLLTPCCSREGRGKAAGKLHQPWPIWAEHLDYNTMRVGHIRAPSCSTSKAFLRSSRNSQGIKDGWLQSNYPSEEITINSELPNYKGQANLGNH